LRVDWIILCRYCEVNNGLVMLAGGGFDAEFGHSFPERVQLCAAIRLVGLPDNQQHDLHVTVEDPQLASTPVLTFSFTAQQLPQHMPGWEVNVMLPAALIFNATTPGSYNVTADVDGQGSKSVAVRVLGPLPTGP
jgi:hypothetical protein